MMINQIKIQYGNYQITQQYIKLGIAVKRRRLCRFICPVLIVKYLKIKISTIVT